MCPRDTATAAISVAELQDRVAQLKQEQRAVILAHNYQLPEVQDVADVVGDSLALARAAQRVQADVIVLCGVHFMAETAAILNPDKRVLLPDLAAGCSLADSITVEQLRSWKAEHPGAVVVSYVNTSAEVKAESDYCCTSANAVAVVQAIPAEQEVLFLPDWFLGHYVQRQTGRSNLHLWMGECHVHAAIRPWALRQALADEPDAELLVHPECGCSTPHLALWSEGKLPVQRTRVLSTGGMLTYAATSSAQAFIVATEVGILHRMQQQNPGKRFIPASEDAVCPFMKKITLAKVVDALEHMRHEVRVEPEVAARARLALERMVAIGASGGTG
ncbi:MAG: quinolinate synthase NadA [Alicyclobacillus sp.]|nr:quinolinate synthase NadA [Alicyclobacillus sp.]